MQKLEIIIEAVELKRVLRILDGCNVRGYSILPNIMGRGSKGGIRSGGDLSDILNNVLIVTVDEPDVIQRVMERIQPLLANYSGVLIVSNVTLYE
ncbi:MAG: P-II family nitrogen regulator [Bacteroidota bacterium]